MLNLCAFFKSWKLNVFLITFETFSEIVLIVFSSSESWLLILRKNYVELKLFTSTTDFTLI